VTASIATGPFATGRRSIDASPADRLSRRSDGALERILGFIGPGWVAVAFAIVATIVYIWSNPTRWGFYDHFVWQARAWLEGHAAIAYPVEDGVRANDYYQDVLDLGDRLLTEQLGLAWEPGRALIPFPPLPAIILLPFVAVWGLATQGALVFAVLGGINVGLCFRMLTRVTSRRDAAFLGTVTYGFGTVAWYASMLGTTWFQGHVAASTFLVRAITAALDAEHREAEDGAGRALPGHIPLRGVGAGVLFGIASLGRLTAVFGAPFFAFVGPGGTWLRRAVAAAIGCGLPLGLLLAYNVATTGHIFHPAYDHIRETEVKPAPELYHEDWGTEDPRYILVNWPIFLFQTPVNAPPGAFDEPCTPTTGLIEQLTPNEDAACPLRPSALGMSIFLTTPAYLLVIPALWFGWRRRLVVGAAIAVLCIALADLAHFSQGWVQFGYRFSNDFAPFAMILVALGIAESRRSRLGWLVTWLLVIASVVVNAWGVMWGVTLRW
jgi:hypothetical protein